MKRFMLALVVLVISLAVAMAAEQATVYVSPAGNDNWSGKLPAPNAAKTDGPLATLPAAVAAARKLPVPRRIVLREGKYCLNETLKLGPEDTGLSFVAFGKENPQIIGGRLITGLKKGPGGKLSVFLPDVKDGKWSFKSLFMDGKRLVRARTPNVDATDPYRKGFFYTSKDKSAFGISVGCIHNPGDWMDYKLTVPADGDYTFWMYYGALNAPHGNTTMDGRTVVKVDGGEAVPLMNLPDTGGWGTYRWANCATVKLTAGEHILRWENLKGGGLNFEAYALTTDPAWKPVNTNLPPVAADKQLMVVQAENFVKYNGKQLSVGGSGAGEKDRFHYADGELKPEFAQAPGAEVHIFQTGNCRAFKEIAGIASIDPEQRQIVLSGPELSSQLHAGDRYFVENIESECDAPGEWYLNQQTGVLTIVPPPGWTEKSEVMAPTVGRIVEITGGKDVTFTGLTIRGGDWDSQDGVIGYGMGKNGVLYFKDSTGCGVRGCSFFNVGKDAVCFETSNNNTIADNDITDSAEGGINLNGSNNTTVSGNHIHHLGQVYKHNGGVTIQNKASNNLVTGNVVHDMTRYGISMKMAGTQNTIEHNRVLNTSLETYDTGAIEVTQQDRNERSGTKIRYNIVGDSVGYSSTGDKPCFLSWGIYLDSFAGGYEVTNNIVYRSWNGGIMFQGGKDNIVTNNVLVDGQAGQGHISNFSKNQTGCVLERNIVTWSNPQAMLFVGPAVTPEVIRCDRNLYWCPGVTEYKIMWGGKSFEEWQKLGHDANSVMADPLFTDPKHDDYSLKPGSPALKLGFKPIDTGKVARPCKCRIVPLAPVFFPQPEEK